MKFTEVSNKANELFKEHHEVKFYEMILYYAVEELFVDTDEIELSDYQFNELLNCMVNYLADNYHVSPWHVADAIVNAIKTIGIENNGVNTVITDFDNGCELIEAELEKL